MSDTDSWELRYLVSTAVEKRHSTRQQFRDQALCELLLSLAAANPHVMTALRRHVDGRDGLGSYSKNDAGAEALASDDTVWKHAESLLQQADFAVTRYPDDGRMLERWSPQPLNAIDAKGDADPSALLDQLTECTTDYIRSGWALSPVLELWLVRQMIFAETFAFFRERGFSSHKRGFQFWWTWTKSITKWVIGLIAALSIAEAHGPAIGVLSYVAWLSFIRFLAQDQVETLRRQVELTASMQHAYRLALRTPACPTEIERAVSRAESLGAVWPAGLIALIGKANARNPAFWA